MTVAGNKNKSAYESTQQRTQQVILPWVWYNTHLKANGRLLFCEWVSVFATAAENIINPTFISSEHLMGNDRKICSLCVFAGKN